MTKITALPAGVTADGTEKIAAVQGGITVQLTLSQASGSSQPLDATLTSLASLDPFVIGDLLYANTTTTLAKLPAVASGQPLVSGGVATASGYAGSWANFVVASKRLELRRGSNTFPVFGSTSTLFVQGADTGEGRIDIGACTSDAVIAFGRVDGTWNAPLIPAAGSQICGITGGTIHADGATALQQGGYMAGYMRNKWSASDHSWYWDFGTIAGGSTTLVRSVRISDTGGLQVGPADVYPASGIINADTGYTVNSAAASSGNVLRGDGTKFVSAQLSPADLSVGAGSFTTVAYNSTLTGTTTNANAVAIGRQGATNPAFQVDASAATSVTGLKVTAQAAGNGTGVLVVSSGTNENLFVDAKGSGTVNINVASGTGAVALGQATTVAGTFTGTSANASALAVGRQGATNPVLQVDASTATVATGLKIKGAAAAGGLALSVITSGTNENLTLDAAGSGTITVGGTSTGAITLTRATTMSAALTYGGVTLSNAVTGTGNMVLSASPTLSGTVGGALTFSGALTLSSALTYGGVTLSNAVTGTGNMALSAGPTFTGTLTAATLAPTTINAFTLAGTIAGGGNQLNNIIIGTSTPLAGSFTTATASTSVTSPILIGGSGTTGTQLTLQTTTGNGTTDALAIKGGNNGATTIATMLGTGFVGISDTSPQYKLTVNRNATSGIADPFGNDGIGLIGPDSFGVTLSMQTFGNSNPAITMFRSAGTNAAKTAVASGSFIGQFQAFGYAGSTSLYAGGAGFNVTANQTFSTGNAGTRFEIVTTPDASTTLAVAATFYGSKGMAVGTATDPGAGMIYTNSATFMIRTKTSYTNGAGIGAGTITTAPSAGNPTKWIPVDDNGTTRYIPAW